MAKARLGNLPSAFRPRHTPRARSRFEGAGPPLATYMISLKRRPVIFTWIFPLVCPSMWQFRKVLLLRFFGDGLACFCHGNHQRQRLYRGRDKAPFLVEALCTLGDCMHEDGADAGNLGGLQGAQNGVPQ